MRFIVILAVGILSIYSGKSNAQVVVTSPVEAFWGSDGDSELEIYVNVTSDSGWDGVTVQVQTPNFGVGDASTADTNPDSVSRIYSYTVTSLFIDDAGTYTFTAADSGNQGGSSGNTSEDDSSVEVYIYTVSVLHPESQYYAVERTTELTISSYVRTDSSWDDITVTTLSPSGQGYTVTMKTTTSLGSNWRYYTSEITDIVPGEYKFTVTEALGGQSKAIEAIAMVEVNPTMTVDEYLYRIQFATASLTAALPDFYSYFYDGPDSTYVLDGGNDMYDRGNYLSISTSEDQSTSMVPYGKPYGFQSYQFSSVPTYPFTSLMWITNSEGSQTRFGYQVASQTGVGTGNFAQSELFNFHVDSYHIEFATFQVFDLSTDPSICEVYFYVSNPDWESVDPENVTMEVAASPPNSLENHFTLWGPVKNVMMGYTLLSRSGGEKVDDAVVQGILTEIAKLFSQVDGVSISAEAEAVVEPDENSITLSSRIVAPDWSTSSVRIATPSGVNVPLTYFTEDGNARIYPYTIANPDEQDNGVYTFIVTDFTGYQLESSTTVQVLTATIRAAEATELYQNTNNGKLEIPVLVTTNDWANISVMVVVPNGNVEEAVTTDVGTGERRYSYTMPNLFIEDAGVYTFYASRFGEVSSDMLNITVYLRSIDHLPEQFDSHIAGREDKSEMMIYAICDGDWANVNAEVKASDGKVFPMEMFDGPTDRIRVFAATVTDVTEGLYWIALTEQVQATSLTLNVNHIVERHNGTVVDDYLYRILIDSDQLVSYISNWTTYWYDGPDYTNIADGGNDMYNGGNAISLEWGTLLTSDEVINQPYGKPYDNGVITFSSKSLYPFVSMMWITNTGGVRDRFGIEVEGTAGSNAESFETYRRILVEGTYTVTYETFQVLQGSSPTICEVYFMITNPSYWDSVEPDSFNVTVGKTPPQFLGNKATVSGPARNIMMGYTLLASSSGAAIPYLEVDLVLEHFVSRIAEKDQFAISPVVEEGRYTAVSGEDTTIDIMVVTSGRWEGVSVHVITPSGSQVPVTKYRYGDLNTQRYYEYDIADLDYDANNGDYEAVATDAFGDEKRTPFSLHVFTAAIQPITSPYVGEPGGEVRMSVSMTTRTWLVLMEVDTPTLGTLPVESWTESGDNPGVRTYFYTIPSVEYERDQGQYVFRLTEIIYNQYTYNVTDETTLEVFSVVVEPERTAYTVNEGDEILEIAAYVYTMSDPFDVSVSIRTPSGATAAVEGFTLVDDRRLYVYTVRGVTSEDAGEYRFSALQRISGESYRVEGAEIGVVVKGGELSSGEIVGIVFGSIAGACLFAGIGWALASRRRSTASKSPDTPLSEKKAYENKAAQMEEMPERKDKNGDDVTSL